MTGRAGVDSDGRDDPDWRAFDIVQTWSAKAASADTRVDGVPLDHAVRWSVMQAIANALRAAAYPALAERDAAFRRRYRLDVDDDRPRGASTIRRAGQELTAAEVVVSEDSTAALDASLAGKPLVHSHFAPTLPVLPLAETGAALAGHGDPDPLARGPGVPGSGEARASFRAPAGVHRHPCRNPPFSEHPAHPGRHRWRRGRRESAMTGPARLC